MGFYMDVIFSTTVLVSHVYAGIPKQLWCIYRRKRSRTSHRSPRPQPEITLHSPGPQPGYFTSASGKHRAVGEIDRHVGLP